MGHIHLIDLIKLFKDTKNTKNSWCLRKCHWRVAEKDQFQSRTFVLSRYYHCLGCGKETSCFVSVCSYLSCSFRRKKNTKSILMFVFFEPTCVYARWAWMHRFLYVCDQTKIHISPTTAYTWYRFKVKGHCGEGQASAQDIGSWAHIKIKLLPLFCFHTL